MENQVIISSASNRREVKAFVQLPWKIYHGDPNWVPPLISDRLDRLNPRRNPFFSHAKVKLLSARRGRTLLGTIAVFVDHQVAGNANGNMGGFGFFEAVNDYEVARALLDAACLQARQWGVKGIRGPTNFGANDEPGILIEGADCPPALLEAHTPPYYKDFLERYGMDKEDDLFAWRVPLAKFQENLSAIPGQLMRVFEAAMQRSEIRIRKVSLRDWDSEIRIIHALFNETLKNIPGHVPITEQEFHQHADPLRPLLDPDLAMIAEVNGEPVGFFVAIPDFNRVLIHLNGRLFPFGWIKLLWYSRRIDVISFKLLGVREEYRRRGVDVKMYLEALQAAAKKGYKWLDGSLTSEANSTVVRLADRLGAERYKHYRLYRLVF